MMRFLFPVLKGYQRKLSQLTPEQHRLSEKVKNMELNNLPGLTAPSLCPSIPPPARPSLGAALLTCVPWSPVSTMSTMRRSVSERSGTCTRLRQQLDALERETASTLADMDQYNNGLLVRAQQAGPSPCRLNRLGQAPVD